MTLGSAEELLRREVLLALGVDFEKRFEAILRLRSETLQELFEIGITSRLTLDETLPIETRIEQVRKEMEDLASDLDLQLPSLPRKHRKLKGKLKGMAATCNELSARHFQLERILQERMQRKKLREEDSHS